VQINPLILVKITYLVEIRGDNQEKYTGHATKYFECKYLSGLYRTGRRRMIGSDVLAVETIMQLHILKRLFSRLVHVPHATQPRASSGTSAFSFDPFWHGDHWQNLLASPMDARHYVVEDWAPAFDESSSGAWTKDGDTARRRRR